MRRLSIAFPVFFVCGAAHAQYPANPVRMVVASTAGSETDYLARIVSQKLAEQWGQQVVVENRPDAGGVLPSSTMVAAPADGHTLLTHSMAQVIRAAGVKAN